MACYMLLLLLYGSTKIVAVDGNLEQGRFDYEFSMSKSSFLVAKTMFAGTKINLAVTCDAFNSSLEEASIRWRLRQIHCYQDLFSIADGTIKHIQNNTFEVQAPEVLEKCIGNNIIIPEFRFLDEISNNEENHNVALTAKYSSTKLEKFSTSPIFIITKDGLYTFHLDINLNGNFAAHTRIEFRANYGYLSASDWPLLPFYGIMCLVYVVCGITWLAVSFLQWRELLRIQFWIGGVIFLGMLEKAVFYVEYQNVNSTGVSVQGAELIAEWVSCAKRTLARMLVIIVSLGFGIVKPHLGSMLHRVVGAGLLYFILASIEGYLRVMHVKHDQNNQTLVAGIPLTLLDSAICWWIFTSLAQTTRTLRLRRNMVKLSLYRHFTNTLLFAVVASILFMIYMVKLNQLNRCAPVWREIWVENAFWHVLFSVLLSVIMILWRPTNNNQRYAYTPLLDNPEDEDDDDEQFVTDLYGIKMRITHSNINPQIIRVAKGEEDNLRWVEENIPSSLADSALPIIDSDEELMSKKFEISKMQ